MLTSQVTGGNPELQEDRSVTMQFKCKHLAVHYLVAKLDIHFYLIYLKTLPCLIS